MMTNEELQEQERQEQEAACRDVRLNVPLPWSKESEEWMLSVLLTSLDQDQIGEMWQAYGRRLRNDLFEHVHNRTVFLLIEELAVSGQRADVVTFTGQLRHRQELDLVGGPSAISALFSCMIFATPAMILYHLGRLEEMRARRGMLKAAWSMAAAATDTTQGWKAAIEKAEGDLFNLHEQSTKRGTRHIKEVVGEVVAEIELAYNNKGHIAGGVQLGFTDLDRVIMGLKTGLFVIAARPSRGKTVLACQIALNVGTGRGHYHEFKQAPIPVLFFSLETTDRALTRRMLLNEWTVPISKARDGLMSRAEQDKLGVAVAELKRSQIWLHESFGMTIQELRATARMQISRLPERTDGLPKCVVLLDYLQLLSSSSRRAQQSRQIEIAEISMGLKHLAHEFDIPVITLAQLNRDGDKARPGMADLRESGQIEQDADYIGMICDAPEELTQGEDGLPSEQEYMGFDLAKNKDGPTTTDGAPLVFPFDKSIFRLRSMGDSLLSNNTRDYQPGYAKKPKASKKEPGKNWRDKSAPAGASLTAFDD
jgi:replicative DNA helicase